MNHRPRKRFGQHFLHDPGVIRRIVDAIAPQPGQTMVEIGPGQGAITCPLLDRLGRLEVVEIDTELAATLGARCADRGDLRIHVADALEFDFRALAPAPHGLRVVGNLPYNISTPLLFHLLDAAEGIGDMHFLLQKEVVDRLTAPPGTRDYGRLSVMVQHRCATRALFRIGPGAFRPPPRVDSALVRIAPYPEPPFPVQDTQRFALIVRTAFSHRRKTLRRALAGVLEAETIEAAGIDPGRRPETLTVEEFVRLANA
ncbi:MAG TPA: 16S rRNA (adenine(1518)-N(6)/adenine(1519)-N(6))-dimethyltransferase RsmA [Chromatiales bacterium]|nr:16S rRNA (adenine(1518)-N(6)/adenine(1519)-N(6))-dimethyltransferase RsmA [Chromatiales bacterium]